MGVRRYARDAKGRFSGGGTVRGTRSAPAKPTGGSMTRALRRGQRALYRTEQDRIHALGGNVAGMRIIRRDIKKGAAAMRPTASSATAQSGSISGALRGTLRQLAQSDARYFKGVQEQLGGSKPSPRRRLPGGKK